MAWTMEQDDEALRKAIDEAVANRIASPNSIDFAAEAVVRIARTVSEPSAAVEVSGIFEMPLQKPDHASTAPADHLTPDWGSIRRVHDWKNYVPVDLRPLWPTLAPEVRAMLAAQYEGLASLEEWD